MSAANPTIFEYYKTGRKNSDKLYIFFLNRPIIAEMNETLHIQSVK